VCVSGIWQVENDFSKPIDFELYTEKCENVDPDFPVEEYDMYGASPWGNIPDVLEMYGMCSYRNWFEYLEFVDPQSSKHTNVGRCANLDSETQRQYDCGADAFEVGSSQWWDTQLPDGQDHMPTLLATKKFRVHAHECDRDYMHIINHNGCAPVVRNDNSAMGIINKLSGGQDFKSRRAGRNQQIQTIERKKNILETDTEKFIDVISRPVFANDPVNWPDYRKYGFLSMKNMDSDFNRCKNLKQCFVDPFTFNGDPAIRSFVKNNVMTTWTPSNADSCGIFGNPVDQDLCGDGFDQQCCELDRAVLPLYEVLCVRSDPLQIYQLRTDCQFTLDTLNNICAPIGTIQDGKTYYGLSILEESKNIELQEMGVLLNSLMDAMVTATPITTSAVYLQVMTCSTSLYAAIQTVTVCTATSTVSPYCTAYHQKLNQDATPVLARSGLYYMLRYTMHEVPFAW
jgi:hypothetical protein